MTKALILVDIQNDFLPGGALAVTGGDEILPTVYRLVNDEQFQLIVASKGTLRDMCHSLQTHGAELFSVRQVPRLNGTPGVETLAQVMWPDHCVQGSHGSELEDGLQKLLERETTKAKTKYVHKGSDPSLDSYSAFADNEYSKFTDMGRILYEGAVKEVHVIGLATDYCVRATAIDARKFGFSTVVHADGVRAVDGGRQEMVLDEMRGWGCQVVVN